MVVGLGTQPRAIFHKPIHQYQAQASTDEIEICEIDHADVVSKQPIDSGGFIRLGISKPSIVFYLHGWSHTDKDFLD